MSFAAAPLMVPLELADDGVVRIGGTRVTLDTLMAAYQEGFGAEEIVQQYPTLKLADVYSVLGYVLGHAEEVDNYLEKRRAIGLGVRRENELRFPAAGVRDRLLARKKAE